MAPVLKTGRAQALVGSNPTPSATLPKRFRCPRTAHQVQPLRAPSAGAGVGSPGARVSSFEEIPSDAQLLKSAAAASNEIIVITIFNVANVALG
jgi:hypothetical protein